MWLRLLPVERYLIGLERMHRASQALHLISAIVDAASAGVWTATFQIDNSASEGFDDSCVNEFRGVGCEARNVSLRGTSVNLCLS
jgi:hypothetical protein